MEQVNCGKTSSDLIYMSFESPEEERIEKNSENIMDIFFHIC